MSEAGESIKQGLTESITMAKVMKENEQLRTALKPFSDAVFNDNHELSITPASSNSYYNAYWTMRKVNEKP